MDDLINKIAKELMQELEGNPPGPLKKLFEIERKSHLERYCRNLIITQKDFVMLIHNAHKIGYFYQSKINNFIPKNLKITNEKTIPLHSVIPEIKISIFAKKFINEIARIFTERRYLVAHIFYNNTRWHLFYFDQRDFEGGHFKKGAHIHFVNHLWSRYKIDDIWKSFDERNAGIGGKLHIRFEPTKNSNKSMQQA